MKNKLFFRIIAAFSSSLIILSVFMPFTNIENISLWDIYNNSNMLYMPIMIIIFGSIGLIFFLLNVKTEFGYATSGAMIFFTVMQLVQAIVNDTVATLGIGFYFVAIGGILTGFMAFLCNLKSKEKTDNIQSPNMSQGNSQNIIKQFVNDSENIQYENQEELSNTRVLSQNTEMKQSISQPSSIQQTENQDVQIEPTINQAIPEVSQPYVDSFETMSDSSTSFNQPIPEISEVSEPAINGLKLSNMGEQANENTINNNPEILPNRDFNSSVSAPLPSDIQNTQAELLDNSEAKIPNPVVRDFMDNSIPNSTPVINDNSSNSSNMQNLDIFGNFK